MKECISMFNKVIMVEIELMEILLYEIYGIDIQAGDYTQIFES